MMIRFTKENWERFKTHNKTTTIRTKPLKPGVYNAYGGSRYKPEKLGQIMVEEPAVTRAANELILSDALNDGFDSLMELGMVLGRLNPKMTAHDTILYIHKVKVV